MKILTLCLLEEPQIKDLDFSLIHMVAETTFLRLLQYLDTDHGKGCDDDKGAGEKHAQQTEV